MPAAHISILGTFDREYDGHLAIRDAIIHAERELGVVINTRWITPDELGDPASALADSCGILVACRNPKHLRRLMPDVLRALTWARERDLPVFGIEGGYQHMAIEFARKVLGHPEANSTAYDEDCEYPVVKRLDPDLVGSKLSVESTPIEIRPGSRLRAIYGDASAVEEPFRSHFALNPDYVAEMEDAGICMSARGTTRDLGFVAALERPDAAFWVGVAFLPHHRSSAEAPHPLFLAFVKATQNQSPS